MADDVLYHPSAALRKRIDSLSSPSTSELIGLLIEHLDAGSPRNWLAQAVKEGRFSARAHGHDILKLLTRASRWSFYTGQVEDESGKAGLAEETAPAASVPSALSEDAGRNIEELAFAQSEADSQLVEQFRNIAEAERYPNFPPSWGLDTATWTQTFGDHDPVPVINFYLASFFDEDISATGYTAICLSEPDFVIWHAVIAALAGIPWRIRIDEPELTAEQKARALQAALGLPEEIGPGLSLADSDLSEIIGKAPGWMASRLADWWTLDDIAWQRTNVDGVDDVLPDQVEVIYRIMIRHLVDWKQMDEEDLRDQFSVVADDLVNLPDYLPTCAHSYSRLVDAFWDAVDEFLDAAGPRSRA